MGIGVAVWQKPTDNRCYRHRNANSTLAPLCSLADDADAAWYVPMQPCMHRVPMDRDSQHGSQWPAEGRQRLTAEPDWLEGAGEQMGAGEDDWEEGGGEGLLQMRLQAAEADADELERAAGYKGFRNDTARWLMVQRTYERRMGVDWSTVRNAMDMDARLGGGGAALAASNKPLWSMNVVPVTRPDTLPLVFERGLLGTYHDWCEAFNTYPRTYDLLHADHLLSHLNKFHRRGCDIVDVMLEMDRILRPMGYVIIRETNATSQQVEEVATALHWKALDSYKRGTDDTVMAFQKTMWRPLPDAGGA
eukprot:TRINITY_DN24668_c0_g4_i1.p2 TRINITY_DN24668_c0_g4~~TRINITY_DN24668_c0_g4_i1.p2  ORF type:complete len:354 (+),score=16.74 TRINITY_DN24668_c0_g4_i1:150-1064(+)